MFGLKNAVLFLAAAALPTIFAAPLDKRAPQIIPDSFIVTLKQGVSAPAVAKHLAWVGDVHTRSVSKRATGGVEKVYNTEGFSAYAGSFDAATLAEIKKSDDVASVEPDAVWHLDAITTQTNAPWGLGSISHKTPNSTEYLYDPAGAGSGTYAYVIDTGLDTAHPEFGGRGTLGYNAYPNSEFVDHLGHGTHTAGTIGSATYGVAKQATLVSVKVFDWGSSRTSIVLDGYTWAVNDITAKNRAAVSVISMSLGGPQSDAFNALVEAAFSSGILTVASAGNSASDAAYYSPASAPNALTVGAIDVTNTIAYFSNYGPLVDIFAPGVDVESTWIGGEGNTERLDGTSMSCPHVSGLVLYLKSLYGSSSAEMASPGAVSEKIKELGTQGVVIGLEGDGETVNLIAFNGVSV